MTQEEKQLLLVDLCGRLPYGVHLYTNSTDNMELLDIIRDTDYENQFWINGYYFIEDVKPYLRPMSSMTKEEKKEQYKFSAFSDHEYIDWLNAHHFDFRNLIEKGLAIEAPEGMYEKRQEY